MRACVRLTYRAAAPTTIATLALGYADGVHRVLSNKMQVLRRRPAPAEQVGRVCMDQFMVEVPRGIRSRRGRAVLVGAQGSESICHG